MNVSMVPCWGCSMLICNVTHTSPFSLWSMGTNGSPCRAFLDVAGDLDSQTIEVLACWMLEHPLTDDQQAADSPRPEGAPDTPSPDGPETVQCPEHPTGPTHERFFFLQLPEHFCFAFVVFDTDFLLFLKAFCQGSTG